MPFSRDTDERSQQQELLKEYRQETKVIAAERSEAAAKKKKNLQLRLAKVRQRKRLKAGLPLLGEFP